MSAARRPSALTRCWVGAGAAASVVLSGVLLTPSPAAAHGVHDVARTTSVADLVSRSGLAAALLGGTMVWTGLAVAAAVIGPSVRPAWWRRVTLAAASVAAAGDVLALAGSDDVLGGWAGRALAVHLLAIGAWVIGTWSSSRRVLRLPAGATVAACVPVPVLAGGGPVRSSGDAAPPRRKDPWDMDRRRRQGLALVAVVGLAALGLAGHEAWTGRTALVHLGVTEAHLVAAAVWVGGVLHLLVGWDVGQARRFGKPALVAAATTIGTGAVNVRFHLPAMADVVRTTYGRTLLAKIVVVVAVVLASVVVRRRLTRRAARAEGAGMAAAVALAAVLVSLPTPALAVVPGQPVIRSVRLGERDVSVLVTPARPGRNLVRITGLDERPTLSPAVALARGDGDPAWTGTIDLGGGDQRFTLAVGAARATVRVPVRAPGSGPVRLVSAIGAGADAAECQSRQVGQLVAVSEVNAAAPRPRFQVVSAVRSTGDAVLGACDGEATPDGIGRFDGDASDASPEVLGRAYGRLLAGLPSAGGPVVVVAGSAPRSAAFVAGLHTVVATAAAPGPPDAVVVAGEWADASRVLDDAIAAPPERRPTRGIFLAPWLLDPALFGRARAAGIQLTVAMTASPTGAPAEAYLEALARFAPGERPSASGFRGYREARLAMIASANALRTSDPGDRAILDGLTPAPTTVAFYAPASISIMPADLAHDHDAGPSWVEGGALASVSSAIPLG